VSEAAGRLRCPTRAWLPSREAYASRLHSMATLHHVPHRVLAQLCWLWQSSMLVAAIREP